MIRYRYATALTPPAPVVNVTVVCPATGKRLETQPAQIDTGADCTVLPNALVTALGLVEDGRFQLQGFTGKVVELPVFLVDIHVHDRPAVAVRAVLGENESLILLGRDVLNSHRLVLDGPGLALEIG
jgi:predicted aspartyl protease